MREFCRSAGYLSGGARHLCVCFFLLSISGILAITPHRILLVHSFGRDYAPFNAFTETFRNELARQLGDALVFYDVNLESARVAEGNSELPFSTYLRELFEDRPPDLVVPIGGPAARFAQRQRVRLFPDTPMLIAATDERHIQAPLFGTNETAVCCRSDPTTVIDGLLQVLPATTNVAVIIGDSPLERFWLEELHQDFQRFTDHVGFTYYNHLSFSQMQKEVSKLPPRSAIFFGILYVDAQGVPFAGLQSLSILHSVANAPIFGIHDSQLGYGVVGGPMLPITKMAVNTAKVGVRILRGEVAGTIKVPSEPPSITVYDWRELQRWGISERRLPPGSIIRFREPGLWELYKGWIFLGFGVFCAAVVGLHFRHKTQVRAAEEGQAAFTRQLILSQEEERKRIAGELHDGLAQVLVMMKNKIALLRSKIRQDPNEAGRSLDELAVTASQALAEVRTISQALRPAAVEQTGITGAIEWLAHQASESATARFSIDIENFDDLLPRALDINLYRIVQEGLNNVLKHAQASNVILEVKRLPGQLSVSIFDDGVGFDVDARRNVGDWRKSPVSLGLVSMTERAKLLGGNFEIKSAQGRGTRLDLTIPLEPFRNGWKQDNQTSAKKRPAVIKATKDEIPIR